MTIQYTKHEGKLFFAFPRKKRLQTNDIKNWEIKINVADNSAFGAVRRKLRNIFLSRFHDKNTSVSFIPAIPLIRI